MTPARSPAHLIHLSQRQSLPTLAQLAVSFAVLVTKWDVRRRTRRALATLEPHLLEDVGLTSDQALSEAYRPFWRD